MEEMGSFIDLIGNLSIVGSNQLSMIACFV